MLVRRILYKIVENDKILNGIEVIENQLPEYMVFIRKKYPDATYVYLEVLHEYERPDESSSSSSVIILG